MASDYYLSAHTSFKKNQRSETLIIKALQNKFGNRTIEDLSKADVLSLRDEMIHKGRSGSTVCHYLNAISQVYQMLTNEWGLQTSNPVIGVKRPKQGAPRHVRLSPLAVKALFEACSKSSEALISPVVLVALETAMRQGEILALEWKDVDFSKRRIYIRSSKNGQARCVPASNKVLEILQSLPRDSCSSVFPIRATSLRKHYKKAVRRAELHWDEASDNPFKDLTFHDLRHQALSHLSDLGLNVIELSEISGHRTLNMLKRYTHPTIEVMLRKIDGNQDLSYPTTRHPPKYV